MNQNLVRRAIENVVPTVVNSGLCISLATFQLPDGLTSGGFVSPAYSDVSGLINIPCTAPPLSTGSGFSADETKAQSEQSAHQEFHVWLAGWFPTARDVWRQGGRVVIDGTAYDLTGVEWDSQQQQTRVRAKDLTI